MKEFEINNSEGGNLQNPGWIRGEIISAWQHHQQVAVGGSVLIWLALMLGEKRITEKDRKRMGVDPDQLWGAWRDFKLTRVGIHKLHGVYSHSAGEYWDVKIDTQQDEAVVQHVKSSRVEGYLLIRHPSLSEIIATLQRFGWNAG